MTRTIRGQVIERKGKRGTTYAVRFQVSGERYYLTLGNSRDGWSRPKAELELQNVLADVRRGTWTPPTPVIIPVVTTDAQFWEFASQWFAASQHGWAENTIRDYRWQLDHLLPFFYNYRLSEISVAEVDRFKHRMLETGRLSNESINKMLTRLGQILERAVEYEMIPRNPVKVGKRKLKVTRYQRDYLDNADHVIAVLDAASELDADARRDHRCARRAMVAVLMFTGLRVSEACALRWRHVDLAGARLRVPGTKTGAAVRWVRMLPILRDELAAHKTASRHTAPDDWLLPTSVGTQRNKDSARQRVWLPVLERANQILAVRNQPPLPERLTLHSLRMTCCSLRLAMGEDLAYVAEQLGHADTTVTHRYYLRVMRMDTNDRARLLALVNGGSTMVNALIPSQAPTPAGDAA